MLVGQKLLEEEGLTLSQLSHRNVNALIASLDAKRLLLMDDSAKTLERALKACYGDREISLQQLSATFRRGDLLEML